MTQVNNGPADTALPNEQPLNYTTPALPGVSDLPGQQQTLLSDLQGAPNMGGFTSNWATPWSQAPGMVTGAGAGIRGLDAYSGADPTFGGSLTKKFGQSDDVTDIRKNLTGILAGKQDLPFLGDLLKGFRDQNTQAMDELRAGQASRGVVNSTPGFEARNRLKNQQQAALAGISLDALSRGTTPMLGALGEMGRQDLGRQKGEIGRQQGEFGAELQGQGQGFGQGLAQNQALGSLGQALGGAQLGSLGQDFSQQMQSGGQQGALMNQIFNQGMGVQDRSLAQFMGLTGLQNTLDNANFANKNAAINSLMGVLSGTGTSGGASGLAAPAGGPSTTQSLMELLMTPGIGNSPLGQWLGLSGIGGT